MAKRKLKIHSSIKVNVALAEKYDRDRYLSLRERNWSPLEIFRAGMYSLKTQTKRTVQPDA